MPDTKRADAFLRQATADVGVSELDLLPEFAARYFLQQAVEKALKAFGYAKFAMGHGDDGRIDHFFFNRHDPLKVLTDAEQRELGHGAHQMRRELKRFVEAFSERVAIEKVDATTAQRDPSAVSYRYPFFADGGWTTPSEYRRWTEYQGGLGQVRIATKKLLAAVGEEISFAKRR